MKTHTLLFGLFFISLTLLGTVAGQLCIKKGMLQNSYAGSNVFLILFKGLTNPWVITGLLLAVVAACAWIITLSRLPLSYAYPFLSITFPIVVILSSMLFNETVSLTAYGGLGLIVIGLIITSFAR